MEIELYRNVNTANSEAECNMLIFVELQDFEYTGQEVTVNMIDEREESDI